MQGHLILRFVLSLYIPKLDSHPLNPTTKKAMLMSGMKEAQSGKIEIGEVSFDTFMTILQHLYTGKETLMRTGCDI